MQIKDLINTCTLSKWEDFIPQIPDESISFVLIDPPYGITHAPWDIAPDFKILMPAIHRILCANGIAIVFGQQPMVTDVISAARTWYRYELIWEKTNSGGFLNAHKMPLRTHENIEVFYKRLPVYTPPISEILPNHRGIKFAEDSKKSLYGKQRDYVPNNLDRAYPRSVIKCSSFNGCSFGLDTHQKIHQTQKPISLLKWLICTYTKPNDIVFDCFAGSRTTAIAALAENRKFICCESDPEIFEKGAKFFTEMQRNKNLALNFDS